MPVNSYKSKYGYACIFVFAISFLFLAISCELPYDAYVYGLTSSPWRLNLGISDASPKGTSQSIRLFKRSFARWTSRSFV